jgi:malate synthase
VKNYETPEGMKITGAFTPEFEAILTKDALAFIKALHDKFGGERTAIIERRKKAQDDIDKGIMPDFLPETKEIREGNWTVDPVPADIQDRRVEITGPVNRKMVINALNSGAKVFMADFEDSNTPSWSNNIGGQINLKDANARTISYTSPKGKEYKLNPRVAVLMVRPRGWHMVEKQITVNGEPVSAGLVDFGLYFFHNAKDLVKAGSGPYFYLPKMEHHLEARLWNDVFVFAQDYNDVPQGTIKATVLIETILASFQLDEILFELKNHSAGFNCGRWDYIFSVIKKFRNIPGYTFPDRSQVTMTTPFMRAYAQLVIKTCHKRKAHAIGGMAAQVPIKDNEDANQKAIDKVIVDKTREVTDGHDGTWVAHPALVPIALGIFNQHMKTANQIDSGKLADYECTAAELLVAPKGTITEAGLAMNINVGILYLESWLKGNGAVAIHNLMEDAATAEISRTQVWQWIKTGAKLDNGKTIDHILYQDLRDEEILHIKEYVGEKRYAAGKFPQAIALFNRLVVDEDFEEFLTTSAYQFID